MKEMSLLVVLVLFSSACSLQWRTERLVGGHLDLDALRAMGPSELSNLVVAAEHGDKYAAYKVALFYSKQQATWLKWMKIAAGLGNAAAADGLSGYYLYEFKPPNTTAAAYWLLESVSLGRPTTFPVIRNAEELATLAPELRYGFVRRGILNKDGANQR